MKMSLKSPEQIAEQIVHECKWNSVDEAYGGTMLEMSESYLLEKITDAIREARQVPSVSEEEIEKFADLWGHELPDNAPIKNYRLSAKAGFKAGFKAALEMVNNGQT